MSAYQSSDVREISAFTSEIKHEGSKTSEHYRHITPTDWGSFFDLFSRQHLGMLVTVEVETPEIGSHNLVQQAPLIGIIARSEPSHDVTIEVIASESPAGPRPGQMSYTIDRPQRVTFGSTEGDHLWIEIEAETGEVVTIRWKA